jgi:mitochondrial fission protein ELM1
MKAIEILKKEINDKRKFRRLKRKINKAARRYRGRKFSLIEWDEQLVKHKERIEEEIRALKEQFSKSL